MISVKNETVVNYRPIRLVLSSIGKRTVVYSQGNTSVLVTRVEGTDKIGGYHVKSHVPLLYKVSTSADVINYEEYRKNRRHYEILEFIEAVLRNVGLIPGNGNGGYRERLDKKLSICVTETDGSSRTTAINAVAMYALRQELIPKVPVAISFGMYNGEVVYDLNYEQDSKGTGDCAIGGYCESNKIYVVSMLYEGTMPINKFIEGLEQSQIPMYSLVQTLKKYGFRL